MRGPDTDLQQGRCSLSGLLEIMNKQKNELEVGKRYLKHRFLFMVTVYGHNYINERSLLKFI